MLVIPEESCFGIHAQLKTLLFQACVNNNRKGDIFSTCLQLALFNNKHILLNATSCTTGIHPHCLLRILRG